MTIETLNYINNLLSGLSIPYEYMEWTKPLSFPFFIGEYQELESRDEDGKEEGAFILTGTTDKTYLSLEKIKDRIKTHLTSMGITDIINNTGIAVSYENAFMIPTGEQGLKRIQINLNIKEWRTN
ncbi:MAG: hypothetical protein ACTTK5_01325 [Candidatus Fimenecus sp.]